MTSHEDLQGPRLLVRRHDRSTGAIVWSTWSPDDVRAFPARIAVAGPHVVAAGMGRPGDNGPTHTLLAVFDDVGVLQSIAHGGDDDSAWDSVVATDDGGVVLAGHGGNADVVVQRLGADLEPQWASNTANNAGVQPVAVASGPGGVIALATNSLGDGARFIHRLDADGAVIESVFFSVDEPGDPNWLQAVEFGPNFMAALGSAGAGPPRMWLRRFASE